MQALQQLVRHLQAIPKRPGGHSSYSKSSGQVFKIRAQEASWTRLGVLEDDPGNAW